MKTICFTLIMTSVIAIYSSTNSNSDYMAKISIFIPDLDNSAIKYDIGREMQSLKGVASQSINIDTKILEMIIDCNLFSVNDFKNSFDKWGWAFEDPIIEDVYY